MMEEFRIGLVELMHKQRASLDVLGCMADDHAHTWFYKLLIKFSPFFRVVST
jgi:hypothetical protein